MPKKHSPTRREFLQGQAALDTVRTVGDTPGGTTGSSSSGIHNPPHIAGQASSGTLVGEGTDQEGYLLSVSRKAMACTFTAYLNASAGAVAVEEVLRGFDLIESLERQLTVYGASSEVLEINRLAASQSVKVEKRLFGLLQLAQRIADETSGAFDITSGPLSKVWGFNKRQGRLPSAEELATAQTCTGFQSVQLSEPDRTIRFGKPELEIQLNGIGKGYALDRMAESLDTQNYILHGGHSSVLARGDNASRPGGGWSVGIRNPLRPAERLGEIVLNDSALGTSGSATQAFRAQGKRYGHILDPRTGQPAEGVYTSTVVCDSAAAADALATAFYVLGPIDTAKYCEKHPKVCALLVCPGKKAGEIGIHAFNYPEGSLQVF